VLAGGGGSFGARSLVGWQVSALAALVGGVAAGFNSRAGFVQALFAGLGAGACSVLALAAQQGPESSPVIDFWVDQLNAKGGVGLPLLAVGLSTCVATGLGGWLGSHVFAAGARD
jgi:hypothetical protein